MTTETNALPRRLVAVALLSDHREVLLCRDGERYTLPAASMARGGSESEREAVMGEVLKALVTAPSEIGEALWLGRFALPAPSGERVDMLELYAARLEGARLVAGADAPRAWASLTSPAPAGRVDPTIALHIMPVLAALVGDAPDT